MKSQQDKILKILIKESPFFIKDIELKYSLNYKTIWKCIHNNSDNFKLTRKTDGKKGPSPYYVEYKKS